MARMLDTPDTREYREAFTARLKAAIGSRPMSEVAQASGLSRQHLHQLVKGKSVPMWPVVVALAVALGVPTDYFRGEV